MLFLACVAWQRGGVSKLARALPVKDRVPCGVFAHVGACARPVGAWPWTAARRLVHGLPVCRFIRLLPDRCSQLLLLSTVIWDVGRVARRACPPPRCAIR